MIRQAFQVGAAFMLGAVAACFVQCVHLSALERSVHAQSRNVVMITHIFSGTDGQSHAEQIEAGPPGVVTQLLPVSHAELHWGAPNSVGTWHTEHQRQYVITLSGHGEIEVAGSQKIPLEPGQLELVEDLTGKGHISRTMGTQDRVTLWLPLIDQTVPVAKPSLAGSQ